VHTEFDEIPENRVPILKFSTPFDKCIISIRPRQYLVSYLRKEGYVIGLPGVYLSVCWFVCLLPTRLHKTLQADLAEISRKG